MSRPRPSSAVESIWAKIRVHLEGEKDRIFEAIKNYPPQITNCDEQFDYLLEERETITRELARMRELSAASLSHAERSKSIDEFMSTSRFVNDELKQEIRSALRHAISDPSA